MTTHADTGVTEGGTCAYAVTAVDTQNAESALSVGATVTIQRNTLTVTVPAHGIDVLPLDRCLLRHRRLRRHHDRRPDDRGHLQAGRTKNP